MQKTLFKEFLCPHCGAKANFRYNKSRPNLPTIDTYPPLWCDYLICNECGTEVYMERQPDYDHDTVYVTEYQIVKE